MFQNNDDKAIPSHKSKKKSSLFSKKNLYFSAKSAIFQFENLGTYFSIFHNLRNWATFSHHFWIIQLMLQPLITNGIIAMLKMKSALCGVTPCNDIYEMYQFCMFN